MRPSTDWITTNGVKRFSCADCIRFNDGTSKRIKNVVIKPHIHTHTHTLYRQANKRYRSDVTLCIKKKKGSQGHAMPDDVIRNQPFLTGVGML